VVEGIHAIAARRRDEVYLVNREGLYRSENAGRSWERIESAPAVKSYCGGIPLVKITDVVLPIRRRTKSDGTPDGPLTLLRGLELYYGNRCEAYRATLVPRLSDPDGPLRFIGGWHHFSGRQHEDIRDIGLRMGAFRRVPGFTELLRGATPVMLANDGGLELSTDATTWTQVGSGIGKINALQVYQVAGVAVGGDRQHFMFGTQDNSLWYSDDDGMRWTATGNEGDAFEIERTVARDSDARLTYYTPGQTWISKPAFRDISDWPDPGPRIDEPPLRAGSTEDREDPSPRGNPTLVERGTFVQPYFRDSRCMNDGSARYREVYRALCINGPRDGSLPLTGIQLTENYGAEWRSIASIPEEMHGLTRVGKRDGGTPTGYQAVRVGSNAERLYYGSHDLPDWHLARLPDLLTRTPDQTAEYPPMNGFRGLGRHAFNYDWGPVYGVDPGQPMHIIAPDAVSGRMAETWNGGDDWSPMPQLTDFVTGRGTLSFVDKDLMEYITNVTAISFNPDDPTLVLVGAIQGGAYFSSDRGRSWVTVPGSEKLVNITSFYWLNRNEAIASTYGRGLWKINIRIGGGLDQVADICGDGCHILTSEGPSLFREAHRSRSARFDAALLALDGRILAIESKNGIVTGVRLSLGASHIHFGNPDLNLASRTVGTTDGRLPPWIRDAAVNRLLVGITTSQGQINGAIFSDKAIQSRAPDEQIMTRPRLSQGSPTRERPYINVFSAEMIRGIPILSAKSKTLVVTGRGFDPSTRIEVAINGNPVQSTQLTILANGNFLFESKVSIGYGLHRIVVSQGPNSNRRAVDASMFFVRNEDETNDPRFSLRAGSFDGDWEVNATAQQGCVLRTWKSRLTIKGTQILEEGAVRGQIGSDGSFQYTRPAPANPSVSGPFTGRLQGETGTGTYRFDPACVGSITLRKM
jgi:hypothetical protein